MSFHDVFDRIRRRMRDLMEEFEAEIEEELGQTYSGVIQPLYTVTEYPDRYEIVLDLPYGDLNALSVRISESTLKIECDLVKEIKFEKWSIHRNVSFKRYKVELKIPSDVDISGATITRDPSKHFIKVVFPKKK
ncbi:Hsp20/alpha crystallin family protein [Thermosphaera chiliense]|uniref:Hsp20/alpha crystallin family protein n=1 Tax=Thermosphaera chiliense TaxID=3402707 RepID=A0A7M1US52_9CREN|nr:Hsp20/alpha crystallin family protein [Thermosphaera aggregans]QOR94283.1 Hsp20/alpha crystallin family protein [Thermosphaera aggregans]